MDWLLIGIGLALGTVLAAIIGGGWFLTKLIVRRVCNPVDTTSPRVRTYLQTGVYKRPLQSPIETEIADALARDLPPHRRARHV